MLAVSAILKRLTAALAAVSLDPYFNNVSLLLTGNGLSGLGNKTFIDSASGLTVSVGAGQPTQGSFNPFNPNYAATFNGSSYLTSSGSQFTMGTGNWTIECWFYDTTGGTALKALGALGSSTSGDIRFGLNAAKPYLDIYQTPGSLTTNTTIAANTWYHMAIVRNGSTTSLYINGTLDSSYTNTSTHTATTLSIGSIGAGSYWTGYISNLRIVKGYALYTSNFTPQAILSNSPLGVPLSAVSVLTLQNGAFVDLSTNNTTITVNGTPKMEMITTALSSASLTTVNYPPSYDSTLHNSVLFDGSSYVYTGTNTNLQLGTSQFTVECWFYRLGDGSNAATFESILDFRTTDNNTLAFAIGTKNTGQVNTYAIPSGATNTDRGAFALNGWNHLAVVNDGTNFRFFINGIQTQTASVGSTNYTQGGITIGRANTGVTGAFSFNGYVSNVRVIKGSALYTSNFTPSVSGLTSTTQTSLLACQDSIIRDNSSNNLSLSTVGNPTVTTTNPFGVKYSDYKGGFYGGSGYFDGSSYLSVASPNLLTNWTFEFWMYRTVASTQQTVISFNDGVSNNGVNFWINTSNQFNIDNGSTGQTAFTSYTVPINQWIHVAASKSGTTTTVYVNGSSIGSNTFTPASVNTCFIGRVFTGPAYYSGYITNFRVINGAALYTSNFAPPTAPVRPTGNTSLLLNFANAGIYDITRKNNLIQYGTASVSTSASKFGGGSMYFDGSSYLTSTSGQAFNFGTDDFTVEMWTYPTANTKTYPTFLEIGNHINTTGVVFLQQNASGNIPVLYSNVFVSPSNTPALTLNTWNHLVYQRSSGNLRIFVNGIGSSTATFTNNLSDSRPTIGYAPLGGGTANYNFTGYIDDLRITKGVARYTANFAVPTRELPNSNITLPDGDIYFNNVSLLLNGNGLSGAQNNTFLDSSVNNLTVTRNGTVTQGSFSPFSTLGNVYNLGVNGGSGYFDGVDGSWCYVTQPAVGANEDYTMEFWVYLNAFKSPGAPRITQNIDDQNTFYLGDGNGVLGYVGGGATGSVGTLVLNKWYHIAVSRQSGNLRLFMNGQLMNTISGANTALNNVRLGLMGAAAGGAASINGYMSNFRFVKGLAVYTASFTPPTSPVTLVSNGGATPSTAPTAAQTSLLLNFTNGGIVDAVGKNNLVTVGNARIDTATKKYGTGSMYFDGSSYLLSAPNSQLALGTGPYTIEFWFLRTVTPSTNFLYLGVGRNTSPQNGGWWIGHTIANPNVISFVTYFGTTCTGTTTINNNVWYHVAISRTSSTSMSLYINGVLDTTFTLDPSKDYGIFTQATIGRGYIDVNDQYMTGYIDDLRITKGVARYTSNFTAPTAPLPIEDV